MKKHVNLLSIAVLAAVVFASIVAFKTEPVTNEAYQFKQFTSIESILAGGVGRSRIIESSTDGQDIGKDLLNFYSVTGINFKNIASNDAILIQTMNRYSQDGWELYAVTTGVQSPSGAANNNQGIYMTRYLFRKPM